MGKTSKRDNAYWLRRLENEHPAIHARLKSGAIRNVRQACVEAGLIRLSTRVTALKREWKKATLAERAEWAVEPRFPIRPEAIF